MPIEELPASLTFFLRVERDFGDDDEPAQAEASGSGSNDKGKEKENIKVAETTAAPEVQVSKHRQDLLMQKVSADLGIALELDSPHLQYPVRTL